ncbi:hypothetical protein K1T71_003565 [Dendrolimus kikuchii]|uniref:Uncharacterized protein n=1 Tax=Dendrolimus kikuchii TaxID=765133 RepID=A0ACC1DCB6_9NEOP|nr:hypothetical protein K1T71_003565 [Dendrolimus kikuchii]
MSHSSSHSNLNVGIVQSLAHSDPNLSILKDTDTQLANITLRNNVMKRKREEDLETFKGDIFSMFKELKSSIDEIKEQNFKLQESVDFTSKSYDEIMLKLKQMEKEKIDDNKYIRQLEEKIEQLEKKDRSTGIEIRNIPKKNYENKQDLVNIIINIGKTINIPIQRSEIKDVFRTKTKATIAPIVAEFTTVILKENMLMSVKKFNKENKNNKLNTGQINLQGISPIFISENLTSKTKRLFFLARGVASQLEFKYCWTSYGKVLLRKDDGSPLLRIETEQELQALNKPA